MITSLRLQNFKAHRDTTVPLGRFTVLVGPNGAGKTSVLEALYALASVVGAAPKPSFHGDQQPADLRNRSGAEPIAITATGESQGAPWKLSVDFDMMGALAGIGATLDGQAAQVAAARDRARLQAAFGSTGLYGFDARKIAAGAAPEASLSPVSPDGANTASVLASLKLADDERFERVQSALKQVVPGVERIRVRRVNGGESGVREQINVDIRGAPDLPAQVLSEGTLVAIALLTAICAASGPRLVLLDDLDHALHPEAQIELVSQLKRLLDQELADVQIVATTHSPYILDELDPEDVQVFALREDGSVATKRLSEHPEAARMKGALTVGQIWSSDHERDWVLAESA